MSLLRPNLLLTALLGGLLLVLASCSEQALVANRSAEAADGTPPYEDPGDPFDNDDDDEPTGDDDDASGSDDDDTEATDAGPAEVIALDPEPDSFGHHYRAPIVVTFDVDARGAAVGIYDVAGYALPVENEWNAEGNQVTARPAQWLSPLSEYTVSIDLGEASLEYSFTTSEVGSPLYDGIESVDGVTYVIDFSSATSETAPALAALLGTLDGTLAWLWQVDLDSSAQDFSLSTGVGEYDEDGDGWSQDLCTATTVLATSESPVQLLNPYFASSPALMTLIVDSIPLDLEAAWLDGDFSPDGSALTQVGFRGYLRADSVEVLADGETGCDYLGDVLGLACDTCPSGVGDCAFVDVGSLGGLSAEAALADIDADDTIDCGDEPMALLNCSVGSRPGASMLALLLALGALFRLRFRR